MIRFLVHSHVRLFKSGVVDVMGYLCKIEMLSWKWNDFKNVTMIIPLFLLDILTPHLEQLPCGNGYFIGSMKKWKVNITS